MLDWLTRPADWLLSAGGFVASWFFRKDATSFTVVQMMFATLMLEAALLASSLTTGRAGRRVRYSMTQKTR